MKSIVEGKTALGIELGSTRIKAMLIDNDHKTLAQGSFEWENRLENGVWTYHIDDVWKGLACAYKELNSNVMSRYGVKIEKVGAIGISAMMHGYLVFDKNGRQLDVFRTWRNTNTEAAAKKLGAEFNFNIPLRWSIAHLYQSILNNEAHVNQIAFITTLSGYVHWKLCGKKVLGIGDASGMFPIDSEKNDYDSTMILQFEKLSAESGFPVVLREILPKPLCAGESAGILTEEGAKLLDVEGRLGPGAPLCPPEGDAGTGMVATNSVAARTGNVSAGTSIFAMLVLEKPLSRVWPEIDMVTTPNGRPVAMVHCNNCTSDLDAWVKLFGEALGRSGASVEKTALYDMLYFAALEGEADCGGVLSYNYVSGEPVTEIENGRPLLMRLPDSRFSLANFMRALIFSSVASLRIGMDILTENEKVKIASLKAHGGLFKTSGVGQRLMAAALGVPVSVMESAGEGGAWGIAILAMFAAKKESGESLESYLEKKVFSGAPVNSLSPDSAECAGFEAYIKRYRDGLAAARAAARVV
ncbi:MAG: FGGY-family carbohydrate kinase [Spirochaetaceae bacterium]|jgi:sugar (pentulose or hexulose) kinase|nr:FGGY-family carbohydrate kinase [Spirochaetaceae bacterium]